jgi:DNA-binding transcriptional regulator YiaG
VTARRFPPPWSVEDVGVQHRAFVIKDKNGQALAYVREQIDGEDAVTIIDMDGLWKTIGFALVTGRKALAPKEVRFLRHHMDLTQAGLGAKLRVSDQTIARWEKGETPVPGPEDLLLRVWFLACERAQPEGGKMLERVREVLEVQERDEPDHPTPITFRHKKKWEPEKAHKVPEYA